uniref:(northern house mosquito) hypothetical protein n=1 Tax=Culex pipiens TaxID=7175 RepID=A0A8D8B6F1_CULPI
MPLTDYPDDLGVLTPGHFLIGEPMFSIPEPDYTSAPLNRIIRLQGTRMSVQDFWKVWSRDNISQQAVQVENRNQERARGSPGVAQVHRPFTVSLESWKNHQNVSWRRWARVRYGGWQHRAASPADAVDCNGARQLVMRKSDHASQPSVAVTRP